VLTDWAPLRPDSGRVTGKPETIGYGRIADHRREHLLFTSQFHVSCYL